MIHIQRNCQIRREISGVCLKRVIHKTPERGHFSEERVKTLSCELFTELAGNAQSLLKREGRRETLKKNNFNFLKNLFY